MSVTVIILCGGKGTRIQPVLGPVPKILAPIDGRPFIGILLKWINSQLKDSIKEIVLSTCVGHDAIEKHVLSNNLNCKISKEDRPLGTLGAVIDVVKKNDISEYILVVNGDTVFDCNLADVFINFKLDTSKPMLIVKTASMNGRYGGYQKDISGKIRLCDKNPDYISLGAFFCKTRDIIEFDGIAAKDINKGKMLDADFLDHKDIRVHVLPPNINFIDIGIPSDYQLAQSLIPINFES